MILLKDIFSKSYKDGKKPVKYASKGQRVTVIAEHGNVLIVEANRVRFSINRNDGKTD